MNCPQCGNVLADDEKFCSRCGTNISVGAAPAAQTQPQQQAQYAYAAPVTDGREVPMTVGQYVGTFIVCSWFGIISLILCIVWAFSSESSTSKKNFCRAILITELIAIGVSIIVFVIIFAVLGSTISSIIQDGGSGSWQYYFNA